MKLLIIVDPQYDFIDGALPVPGALEAMNKLSAYIREKAQDYCSIVITADWHPWNHSSFEGFGGQWPRHCVQYSPGAAIWAPVLDAAFESCLDCRVLTKGTRVDKEEYSIFANADSARAINELIQSKKIDKIDICGLAGDICVHRTYSDALKIYDALFIQVLKEFSPCLSPQ